MIDREALITIISSMDTGKLIEMLGTQGINIANPEAQAFDPEDSPEDWNMREVAVGPANKPDIFDRNARVKMDILEPRRPEPEYMDEDYEDNLSQISAGEVGGY